MKPEHMTTDELIQYALDNETETGPYAVTLARRLEAAEIEKLEETADARAELEDARVELEDARAELKQLGSGPLNWKAYLEKHGIEYE